MFSAAAYCINLTRSSFLPAIPPCRVEAGQDQGWWERAHRTLGCLKMDICVGALYELETSGGVRPWRRRRSEDNQKVYQ